MLFHGRDQVRKRGAAELRPHAETDGSVTGMGELVEVSHQLGFQKPDLPCFLDETHPGFRENDRIGRTVKKPDGKVFLQTVDIFFKNNQ